jgi:putative Ca2+/H+ antiporter (TMEM165/GDT1 family)
LLEEAMKLGFGFLFSLIHQLAGQAVDTHPEAIDDAPATEYPAMDAHPIEDRANEAFAQADIDHDEVLHKTEFVNWWMERAKVPEDKNDIIDFHKAKDPAGNEIPGDYRETVRQTEKVTLKFWAAFVNSVAMILVTELGDKTFFIAAILAMRHDRTIIFAGAIGALAVMTVLSAAIGFALPTVLPRQYTHYAATALFIYFGIRLLVDAKDLYSKGEGLGPSDELEEVEQSLKEKNEDDVESVQAEKKNKGNRALLLQAFTLTFLAEWGDRSQIATIALAAAKDPFGVTAGGILGHSFCTGLAVIGGRIVAARISERQVLVCGGVLFLIFAVHSIYVGPNGGV